MHPRPVPLNDERISVRESHGGWRWRVQTPDGRELAGDAANLESARRSGAFAAAVTESLARTRRRRF